ncbi:MULTISPECIES: TrmB family transcriptional regulator [unclassified Halomicrobium]|uniref:TrmB family transcriptional regulator n=1 Tax=unclassified Halomicrobium TaxID=2610901 RepID=UPI0012983D35|nr:MULTISPECIES: helix-turn-helix domain-containing protein [unclassified Halomicrobium]MBO4248208.1 TrmB family transcriptional regulator [Halomicrobium sp. IBSBa]QGA82667.1 Sugar-specific transcriptional regulator TrmB [Halomicrobium sp. LC1Hm]
MTELGALGLSSYEEKVYRTLLLTGAATATELSEASGVPKGRIYDVLNGLEARKVVRLQSSDPKQYVAVEPEAVVDRLLAERAHELREEWRHYRERAAAVRTNVLPTPPTESSFWLGSLGSEEMQTALQEHTRTAEEFVHGIVGTPYENATWETLQREWEAFFEGASADLTVQLLVSEKVALTLPETFDRLIADQSGDVAVRTLPDVGLSFDVVDGIGTTIDIPHPVAADDRIGVLGIKDSEIVEEFERHFQRLWAGAAPLVE